MGVAIWVPVLLVALLGLLVLLARLDDWLDRRDDDGSWWS